MVDILSKNHNHLSLLETKFLSFDYIKDLYSQDDDFSFNHNECHLGTNKDFYLLFQYFCKGKRLCIPKGSFKSLTH